MRSILVPGELRAKVRMFFRRCRNLLFGKGLLSKSGIDRPPVFIVGCGHSGTSLLLAILASHSRMFAVPYESYIAFFDKPQQYQKLAKQFDRWAILSEKHRWVEKTPKHIFCIGKILAWCPEAKFLFIMRDGRDVACSIQVRHGDLKKGIIRWVQDNQAGLAYLGHPNVHLLKYEDLIDDFESTVGKVLNFLEEPYEDGIKRFHETPKKWYSGKIEKPPTTAGKNHARYRNWQINQPLFNGRGRWKRLSDQEMSLIYELAGDMLADFGYLENTPLNPKRGN